MQRTSKIVYKSVKDLNDRDMAQKVEKLKDINIKHGNETSEINTAMDGRYNSATTGSHKKPEQNASQAIGVACETMTNKKFVIQASFKNKLCWTGVWLKEKKNCSVPVDIQSEQLICPHFNLSQSMTWDMI